MKLIRTFREFLLSGFLWNVVSAVTLQGSAVISTIIVARLLGLEPFGAYSILVSTVMTVAAIAQGGSGLVATKYVAEFMGSDPARVGRVLGMCRFVTLVTGALTSALMFAGAHVLGSQVLGRPELEPLVRLVAAATLFQVSAAYQYGALQGFGAFRELGRTGMLAGLAQIGLTALGAWYGQVTGALLGFVVASAFRTAVLGYVLRRVRRANGVGDSARLERSDLTLFWRFALPAGLAGFVTMPCLWLVTVLVARLPGGLRLVALLSVANQCRQAVLQLPALLNAVSFSVLSRMKGLREIGEFRRVFWSNLVLTFTFSALVVTALIFVAEPVLRLYGRDFASGRIVFVILLLSVLPETLATSFYQIIQTAGRMWHSLFVIAMPRDVLYLVLGALLVPTHGVTAAAAAYGIAHVVGLLATLVMARVIVQGQGLVAER